MYYLPFLSYLISIINFGSTWLLSRLYLEGQSNDPILSNLSNLVVNNNFIGDIWLFFSILNFGAWIFSLVRVHIYNDNDFELSSWTTIISLGLSIVLLLTM